MSKKKTYNPPKEENEQEYWRRPLIECELESIATAQVKDPDQLRKRFVDDQRFLSSLCPETLLCVIDQYYDPKDKEKNDDVVNSLSGVLVKKSIERMTFFKRHLYSNTDKLDVESHINYTIGCMIEDRKGYRFARYQFDTVLQRQIIDEFRRSARKYRYILADAEELIKEERRRREGAEAPLFEKQLSDRDEIDSLLRRLDIDQRKKQAFLLRNICDLSYEVLALYFRKQPDTIRKWCDEVKKRLSLLARKVKKPQ